MRILFALCALAFAVPAFAGSPNFVVSQYTCSDVYWGAKKVGDNCVSGYDSKLEVMESLDNDGHGSGEDDGEE